MYEISIVKKKIKSVHVTVKLLNLDFCQQENHVNLVHIESRKSKRRNSEFEILVDCDSNREQLSDIIQLLRKHVNVLELDQPDNRLPEESGTNGKSCLHAYFYTKGPL